MESIINNLSNTLNINPDDLTFILICAAIFLVTLILAIFIKDEVPEAEVAEPEEEGHEALEEAVQTEKLEPADLEEIQGKVEQEIEAAQEVVSEPAAEFTAKTETEDAQTVSIVETRVEPEAPPAIPQEIEEKVAEETVEQQVEEAPKESLFSRLRKGLSKTRTGFIDKLDAIISRTEIDDEIWDDFEETLVMADLGVTTTMKLREDVEREIESNSITDPHEIKTILKAKILTILKESEGGAVSPQTKPFVMMVAGVNGAWVRRRLSASYQTNSRMRIRR